MVITIDFNGEGDGDCNGDGNGYDDGDDVNGGKEGDAKIAMNRK